MFIEFRWKNWRCFRDEQLLSMVASRLSGLPQNVAAREDQAPLLRTAAVYGANGSGKSSVLQALSFMQDYVQGSAKLRPSESGTGIKPFLLDTSHAKGSVQLEASFYIESVRYQYGFELGRERVLREWLTAFPKGVPQRWLYRDASRPTTWSFSSHLKGEKLRIKQMTRPDALFLSLAAQLNHVQLIPIYRWFDAIRFTGFVQGEPFVRPLLEFTASQLNKDEEFAAFAAHVIRMCDLGIEKLTAEKRKQTPADMPSDILKLFTPEAVDHFSKQEHFIVRAYHRSLDPGSELIPLPYGEESDGTKRLIALLGPLYDVLRNGHLLCVDELHASMHPLLTRAVLRLFHMPKINTGNAQLLFTTHDTTLLDTSLLRRDQVWFTEKESSGAAHVYSLADYRPRRDEAIQKGYLLGRYGAIPYFGDELP